MQGKHLALGLGYRAEAKTAVRRAENVRGQPGVGPGRSKQVDVFRRYLLLNVFGVNQLVKLDYVLVEELDHFGIEWRTGHLLQQAQRVFSLHSFAIRTITTCGVIKIDDGNDARD